MVRAHDRARPDDRLVADASPDADLDDLLVLDVRQHDVLHVLGHARVYRTCGLHELVAGEFERGRRACSADLEVAVERAQRELHVVGGLARDVLHLDVEHDVAPLGQARLLLDVELDALLRVRHEVLGADFDELRLDRDLEVVPDLGRVLE